MFLATTRNMVSFSSVLMAPVRGIVWVVKLPFVLVWMLLCYVGSCIYAKVAAMLRYGERERERERETLPHIYSTLQVASLLPGSCRN